MAEQDFSPALSRRQQGSPCPESREGLVPSKVEGKSPWGRQRIYEKPCQLRGLFCFNGPGHPPLRGTAGVQFSLGTSIILEGVANGLAPFLFPVPCPRTSHFSSLNRLPNTNCALSPYYRKIRHHMLLQTRFLKDIYLFYIF